jgi:hypothetical protein
LAKDQGGFVGSPDQPTGLVVHTVVAGLAGIAWNADWVQKIKLMLSWIKPSSNGIAGMLQGYRSAEKLLVNSDSQFFRALWYRFQ